LQKASRIVVLQKGAASHANALLSAIGKAVSSATHINTQDVSETILLLDNRCDNEKHLATINEHTHTHTHTHTCLPSPESSSSAAPSV
jgi:hypothetical protein